MARVGVFAAIVLAGLATACVSPSRDYHGYIADEAQPTEMEPGVDTRSTVLAKLGSPSTESVFDESTWFYMSFTTSRFAFFKPKTVRRQITAIRFGEDDKVEDVLQYDLQDGKVINYAVRETPTLGRRMSLLEQILGSVGAVALPQTNEATPSNPTGRPN